VILTISRIDCARVVFVITKMIFGSWIRNKDSTVVDLAGDSILGIFELDRHPECNTLIPNVGLINNVNKFKQKGCYRYSSIIHLNNK